MSVNECHTQVYSIYLQNKKQPTKVTHTCTKRFTHGTQACRQVVDPRRAPRGEVASADRK